LKQQEKDLKAEICNLSSTLAAKRRNYNAVKHSIEKIEEQKESERKQVEKERLARVYKAGILKAAFQN
jgi:hypothetical protein